MKSNRCFVDTSSFVALNNPNDQHYQDAIDIAKRLDNYQFILSEAMLTETYTLLRYRLGFHIVLEATPYVAIREKLVRFHGR
jgi:predicted nucleic acid-binding protein